MAAVPRPWTVIIVCWMVDSNSKCCFAEESTSDINPSMRNVCVYFKSERSAHYKSSKLPPSLLCGPVTSVLFFAVMATENENNVDSGLQRKGGHISFAFRKIRTQRIWWQSSQLNQNRNLFKHTHKKRKHIYFAFAGIVTQFASHSVPYSSSLYQNAPPHALLQCQRALNLYFSLVCLITSLIQSINSIDSTFNWKWKKSNKFTAIPTDGTLAKRKHCVHILLGILFACCCHSHTHNCVRNIASPFFCDQSALFCLLSILLSCAVRCFWRLPLHQR